MVSFSVAALRPGILGFFRITRFLPVVASTLCAFALGILPAIAAKGLNSLTAWHIFLIVFAGTTLHCITGHAYNDFADWRSGTDGRSHGILSGGSGVIEEGLLHENSLFIIGLAGMTLPVLIGLYFYSLRGVNVIYILLTGVWAGAAYSLPPFRLAYRPLAGEWLALFPAFITLTVGSFFILTGSVSRHVIAAGIIHGLITLGWIMQHHLTDIKSDLSAVPVKTTTPAYVYKKWGLGATRFIPAAYFSFAVIAGLAGGILINPVLALPVIPSCLCIYIAVMTDPSDVRSITGAEIKMLAIATGNAAFLSILLALGF
ncbi:MAG: 1,4-dihydroxy-2-naphthoate octaprenyltransferase [Firmicutes bacterium ADurb.Bin373]|nr:prenyltransferase [Bacillota bacterium]OQA11275.1 MAG: 1,4-dihydroxy-2-naphthoate octaprenyltransferase [Firmicutes bacterium ADurb.Bin373]